MLGKPSTARWGLGLAIALTLLTRSVFALADPHTLIAADVIQDDAFYYFAIARNIVRGEGATFDGEDPTAGFHPLWLALLLPIQATAGDDPWWPVRGAALLGMAIAAATVPLVFGLARRLAGPGAAWVASGAYALSPQLSTLGVGGLETGLALLLGLGTACAYLDWIAAGPEVSERRAIAFGALGGLAVLARVDLAIWLAALGIDWLRRAHSRGALRAATRPMALTTLAALLVWLPWGVVSVATTGAWLPTSGAASREIAQHLGWSNLPAVFGPTTGVVFDPRHVPWAWRADVAVRAVFVWLLEQPLLAPLRLGIDYAVWPPVARYVPFRAFAAAPWLGTAVLVVAAAALRTAARKAPPPPEGTPSLAFATGLYVAAMIAAYVFVSPSHWYFARYLAMPIWLTSIAALAPIARFVRERPLRSLRGGAAVALATGLVLHQGALLAGFRGERIWAAPGERGFLASWEALREHIPERARIGAFQAGIYAWFGDRPVRNLDGKVNVRTQRALAEQRVHAYVLESDLDYVIDQPAMVRLLMLRHAPPEQRSRFEMVVREKRRGGAALYRLERGARPASDPPAASPRASSETNSRRAAK